MSRVHQFRNCVHRAPGESGETAQNVPPMRAKYEPLQHIIATNNSRIYLVKAMSLAGRVFMNTILSTSDHIVGAEGSVRR